MIRIINDLIDDSIPHLLEKEENKEKVKVIQSS